LGVKGSLRRKTNSKSEKEIHFKISITKDIMLPLGTLAKTLEGEYCRILYINMAVSKYCGLKSKTN
jgi:hypothetical protein